MRNKTVTCVISLALLFAGCGAEEKKDTQRSATPATTGEPTPAGSATGSGTGEVVASGSEPAAPVIDKDAAKKHWSNKVLPLLNKECASCHAEPRVAVVNRGPLSIFIYDTMRKMLVDGASSLDNKLIRKVTNVDTHSGGTRCDASAPPCSEIVAWRLLESGPDPEAVGGETGNADADERSAALVKVTSAGKVYGWAVKKEDGAAKVNVKLYLDGPIGTGTLAASTVADKVGDDGNHDGNHHFFVQVPASFATGKERTLYIYGDGDVLLTPEPLAFQAWAPNATGRAYFDSKIKGQISSGCDGCHPASYDYFVGILLTKGPNENGTALDNAVINKPATANGTGHTGGNRCGGVSGGVCAEFQKWWDVEFPAN